MDKPVPMREQSVRNAILLALLVLALGFGATWLYFERAKRLDAEVHYLTLPRVAISRDGHSMAATVAVRTSGNAAGWAAQQQRALQEAVKLALMQADPVAVRGPGGIARLQENISDTAARMLKTDKVQEVLVTDFVVSEGDY